MKCPAVKATEKNRVMQIFDIVTVGLLLAAASSFLYTFLLAYFNGMSVAIYINLIGEADAELVLITITVPCGVVTLVRMFRRL